MKRRALKRIGGKLTHAQIVYLMHGHDWFGHAFDTEEEARAAWFAHREELLAMQTAQGGFESYAAGTKPWAREKGTRKYTAGREIVRGRPTTREDSGPVVVPSRVIIAGVAEVQSEKANCCCRSFCGPCRSGFDRLSFDENADKGLL
jgi:hypothetical protein